MANNKETTSVQITWLPERQVYRVQFKASEESFHQVVKALKSIDFEKRSYNSVTRAWYIDPSELDRLREIAVTHFDNAQLTEGNVTTNLRTGRATEQLKLFV